MLGPLSFLFTALLVPFSPASSVDLKDRWIIGDPTSTNSGNTFTFQYPGMSKEWLGDDPYDKIRATIYNKDCNGTVVNPSTTLETEQSFSAASLDWDSGGPNLLYSLTTNPRQMFQSLLYGSNPLVFCVRLGLYGDGSSSDEINFQESVVTVDLDFNGSFSVTGIGVAPKVKGESAAQQSYTACAHLCTDDQQAPTVEGNFNQGAAIRVCILLDTQAKRDCVQIKSVDKFSWTRDDTSTIQEAVTSSGVESTNGLTLLGDIDNTKGVGVPNVVVTTVLFAKFYDSEGDVSANGAVTMAFPGAGDSCADAGGDAGGDAGYSCPGTTTGTTTATQEPCPVEEGYCVKQDGSDQNNGVIKYNSFDGNTEDAQKQCLQKCLDYDGATGCEVIWDRGNRGCYIHTDIIDHGNLAGNHLCWVFTPENDFTTCLAPTAEDRRLGSSSGNRRLGSSSSNNNNNNNSIRSNKRRTLQEGDAPIVAPFELTASLNQADDGPVLFQQTAGGTGTSITVVTTTIVGLVSAILLA